MAVRVLRLFSQTSKTETVEDEVKRQDELL